jgi:soluble lytic murein transglycosylase-like protein
LRSVMLRTLPMALGLGLLLGMASRPEPAWAGFYRYVDEQGIVHLSNVPADARYRRYRPENVNGAIAPSAVPWAPARASSPSRFDDLIARAAVVHGVSPALIKAVMRAESNFQPDAVSHKGAQGLMQLMPATAQSLGVRDPLRPAENVLAGSRYLRRMLDRFGDLRYALAAYNAGPQAVDRFGGIPPFPETQQYVNRVLKYYRRYHGDFVQ